MISENCRSCASQTHFSGIKIMAKKKFIARCFRQPFQHFVVKNVPSSFSFLQFTALPGRGPFWPAGLQSSSPSAIVRCGCTSTARDFVWIHTLKLSYLAHQLSEWCNSCQSSPNLVRGFCGWCWKFLCYDCTGAPSSCTCAPMGRNNVRHQRSRGSFGLAGRQHLLGSWHL